jgi:hypothetical protein
MADENVSSESRCRHWNAAPAVAYSHHAKTIEGVASMGVMKPTDTADDNDDPPEFAERTGPREIVSPITGYHVVTRRPGQRMITSEEIKEMLEDFP